MLGSLTLAFKRTSMSPSGFRMVIGLATTSARTRQSTSLFALSEAVTNNQSCKHLCCREGLEKPPKPGKKRAVPNEKTAGLSQLTLAASITKQPASTVTQNSTQPGKGKPALKRNASNLSAGGSSKGPKRIRSNQSLFPSAPVRKASISAFKKEKPKSPPKSASSDFGDEDFADLPSPSDLFGKSEPSCIVPETPVASTAQPEVICVDPSSLSIGDSCQSGAYHDDQNIDPPGPAHTKTLDTVPASQPSECSNNLKCTQLWDDSSDDPIEDIFTDMGYQDSPATSAPLTGSTGNTIRSPKRGSSAQEKALFEQSQKNPPKYLSCDTFPETQTVAVPVPASTDHDDLSDEGWEDIDRCMLEEFKHIINFY